MSMQSQLQSLRERLGLRAGDGHASLERVVGRDAGFSDTAQSLLADSSSAIGKALPDLLGLPGRWHPAGYAVFTLGHSRTLGTARLHVWCAGLRRMEARPPGARDVHDHVLDIASLVLAGTYADTIFEVSPVESGDPAALLVYSPRVGSSGSTALAPTGGAVIAEEVERRSVRSSDSHHIPAGPFHVPTISETETCATFSFSSPPVREGGPLVLFAANVGPVLGAQRPVSELDRSQLRKALSTASRSPLA